MDQLKELTKSLESACEKTISDEPDKQIAETLQVLTKALYLVYNTQFEVNNLDVKINSSNYIYAFHISKSPKCKMSNIKVKKVKEVKTKIAKKKKK